MVFNLILICDNQDQNAIFMLPKRQRSRGERKRNKHTLIFSNIDTFVESVEEKKKWNYFSKQKQKEGNNVIVGKNRISVFFISDFLIYFETHLVKFKQDNGITIWKIDIHNGRDTFVWKVSMEKNIVLIHSN